MLAAAATTTTLRQFEIQRASQSAVVRTYSLATVAEMEADFRAALPHHPLFAVGMSIGLAPQGTRIQTLAIATRDKIFCLALLKSPPPAQSQVLQKLFSDIQYLTGFEFPYTMVLLAHTLGSNISGYDLSTLTMQSKRGEITSPGTFINSKDASAPARRINERWDGGIKRNGTDSNGTPKPNYALRAWITAIAANMALNDLQSGQQLSTRFVDKPMLRCYVDLACRAIRLDLLRPRIQENEFSEVQTKRNGKITVQNSRFKTRIRASGQTHLEVEMKNGDVVGATIKGVKGRRSSAVPERALKGDVSRIRVVGREERTNAEQAQYRFLMFSLTMTRPTPLFVNIVWCPGNTHPIRSDGEINLNYEPRILERLNHSQREIAGAMLSTDPRDSLIIAHGPPGTGKTTIIAAAAEIWSSHGRPCWIIAQSNVGVKNIAETLAKKKVNFKLIVSLEFLFEWHEELYVGLEDKMIRSDELPDSKQAVARAFDDATIVLCTLSTLSNPKLYDCGLFEVVPLKSLVIDEASQIDVFQLMHLFYKFANVLTKVCFFGDPKQLPPYAAKEAGLETIFDINHLKKKSYFLNTQYRLPMRLGEFISANVYDRRLQSRHEIVDHSCLAFVNVAKGEETRQGNSYENMEEVHMVVRVAKRYKQHHLNFCVITFYDPQRAAITKSFEDADLPSGSVFNVDSFQGNEADYVILSPVRTEHAGFLNSQPRMNVALTRCRKGLVVVTQRAFLQGPGRNTLLGQLCTAWSSPSPLPSSHRNDVWIDGKDVMLSPGWLVDLPGLRRATQPAKQPLPPSPPSTLNNAAAPAFSHTFPSLSPSPSPSIMSTWATRTSGSLPLPRTLAPASMISSVYNDAWLPYAGPAARGYNSKEDNKDFPPLLAGPQAIRTRTWADLGSYQTQNRGAQGARRQGQTQTQLVGALGGAPRRPPLVTVNDPFPALGGEVERTLFERLASLNI